MAVSARPVYASSADFNARLRALTVQVTNQTPQPDMDRLSGQLLAACSRRFDRLTGRPPGGFAPVYDQRVFSGRGAMNLIVDEFASVVKVEYNTSPGAVATWTDVTGDFALGKMQTLPVRYYPKKSIWRINTFVVDPYRTGNVRLTGVWGNVQPDGTVAAPTPPWQGVADQPSINALAPDGTAASWWVVNEDVTKAIAEWAVYAYHAGRAGYGQQAGNTTAAPIQMPKQIPADVQAVINEYADTSPLVASVTADGTVIADEQVYGSVGSPDDVSRWADWGSRTVFGQRGGGQ